MKAVFTSLLILIHNSIPAQFTLIPTGTNQTLRNLSVIKNNVTINGYQNYLSKSIDACNTLSLLTLPISSNYFNVLYRLDTMKAYLLSYPVGSGSNLIHKSADGGNSWAKKMDTTNQFLNFICFFDTMEGITIGNNKLLRTKTGGDTWLNGSSPIFGPTCVKVFGDSTICVCDGYGSGADFYLSKDRGNTWPISCPLPDDAVDFFFLNKDTIFSVCIGGVDYPPQLAMTVNGGNNWQNFEIPRNYFDDEFWGCYFNSASEGYVVGGKSSMNSSNKTGIIMKTTNMGQSWTTFDTGLNTVFRSISFLNDSSALVSGSNGVLIKWNSKKVIFTEIKHNWLSDLELKIFPNPVGDKLTIDSSDGFTVTNVTLTNTLGQTLNTYKLKQPGEIDLSYLTPGVYFLKLVRETSYRILKIIKE